MKTYCERLDPAEKRRRADSADGALVLAEIVRRAMLDRHDRPFDPNFFQQVQDRRLLDDDYARMVALSHPTLRPVKGTDEVIRYSQRYVDVINLGEMPPPDEDVDEEELAEAIGGLTEDLLKARRLPADTGGERSRPCAQRARKDLRHRVSRPDAGNAHHPVN